MTLRPHAVRRIILGSLAVAVLAAAGGAALFVSRINPNDYKPDIAALVERATGRAMSLDGPISISFSLSPVITVTQVKLANLPGGSRPYMVRVDKIRAQISLLALLRHRLEIVDLSLTGPNILFEEADHKPNWLFSSAAPDSATAPAPAPSPKKSTSFAIRIRHVHIVNGMITFRLPAKTTVIGIKSLDFTHQHDGGAISIASKLVYSDFAPFDLSIQGEPTGDAAAPWNTRLAFAAFGATASASGKASLDGSYDFVAKGHAPQLEKLNGLLPALGLPPLHDLSFSTHLANGPVRGDLPIIGESVIHIGNADLSEIIPDLSLGTTDLTIDHASGTAQVKSTGQYRKEPFDLTASLGVPADPNAANMLAFHLAAKAFAKNSASLSLDGTIGFHGLTFTGLNTSARLQMPTLANMRSLISPAVPDLTGVSFSGQITLSAKLTQITLTGARLATSTGALAGSATLGLGLPVRAQAKLQAERLDVDALLKAFGLTGTSPGPTKPIASSSNQAGGPLISTADLPWPWLRGPDIDLQAEVDRLTFLQQPWQHLSLSLRLKGGRLALAPLRLGEAPGLVTVSLNADATTPLPILQLRLQAPSLPLAFLANRLGLPGPADGTLTIDTALTGQGASPHALAGSLAGTLSAKLGAGSISNATLRVLAQASLDALHITVPAEGRTAIRCFALDGRFTKGIGDFKTIALDSTYLQLVGDGQVNMGAETMALKLHPMARIVGSKVAVPVLVDGPWRSAHGYLNASGLDKIGLLLDGLFGGDTAKGCDAS